MPPTQPPAEAEADARLAWLVDRAAISDLLLDFARCVDEHDQTGYAANFTEDATLVLPFGTFEGIAAITAMPSPPSPMGTHHISANHMIELDGDLARSRSYLIATHVFDVANPRGNAQAGGWYDCELRRTADGWRFSRVALSIVWETAPMLPGRDAQPSAPGTGGGVVTIDGRWAITVHTPMGDQASTLEVALHDDGLRGTQTSAAGDGGPIYDGRIDGATATWKLDVTTPFTMTLTFTGTIDGDTITGETKAGSFPPSPFDGSRA